MSNRAFSPEPPSKKEDIHGYVPVARLRQSAKSTSLYLTLEQALRLSLSIQACLLKLNRYNRATAEGKSSCLGLTIFPDTKSITVWDDRIRPVKGEQSSERADAGA